MRSSSMQYHVHQKFQKHLCVSVVSTSLHFRHSQQAAIIVSVPIRMYKNVCMHFTYKYHMNDISLVHILYCIIFTSPRLKSTMNLAFQRLSDQHQPHDNAIYRIDIYLTDLFSFASN